MYSHAWWEEKLGYQNFKGVFGFPPLFATPRVRQVVVAVAVALFSVATVCGGICLSAILWSPCFTCQPNSSADRVWLATSAAWWGVAADQTPPNTVGPMYRSNLLLWNIMRNLTDDVTFSYGNLGGSILCIRDAHKPIHDTSIYMQNWLTDPFMAPTPDMFLVVTVCSM
jgi:hypothetical protein